MTRRYGSAGLLALSLLASPNLANARTYQAGPDDYREKLGLLQPGDTLELAPGIYEHLLNITDLNGRPDAWITITGPESGDPAVFVADPGPCCNTVEIRNSSYVAIRHITVDGNHVAGAFGLSAKGGEGNRVHHIRVEHCTFLNHDGSQQTVAISTKTPTWGWEIRGNRILNAGTGMYLGNSDGTQPFIGGVIEFNLISDTIGYNLQIKWQKPRPGVEGMPTDPQRTIIRHNVFIKTDRPSPDGDRPNLLVGGFPDTGPGAEDLYEIYGNLFYHNPRESLLQASGRVTIHDNLFVDVAGTAILLRNHDLPLKLAHVYNNTIYAAGRGIRVASPAAEGAIVVGNLVFAQDPISGQIDEQRDNLTAAVTDAAEYVLQPSTVLGEMDFYPKAGSPARGSPLDLSVFDEETDFDRDFNGTDKGDRTYRGAYAGEGTNPGWKPIGDIKTLPDEPQPGADAGPGTLDAGTWEDAHLTGDGRPDGGGDQHVEPEGCGCRTRGGSGWPAALLLALFWATRRRRRQQCLLVPRGNRDQTDETSEDAHANR